MNDNIRIAIVGNSPNVIGKGYGNEIDSHDIVVRFNNFLLDGYEIDLGRKTDMISVANCITNFRNLDKYLLLDSDKRIFMAADNIEKALSTVTKNKLTINDVTLLDLNRYYIGMRDKMKNYKDNHYPSTGLMVMQYISDEFPNAIIDAYGFSFFKEKKIHFYDNANGNWHDGEKEQSYFNNFLNGKINLHL